MKAKHPSILAPLYLEALEETDGHGRPLYRLLYEYTYRLSIAGGGLEVRVPKQFLTNFASVPRQFWRLFPPAGKYSKAAVVHDYLCTPAATCPRFIADAVFRHMMHELGVPLWKRLAMYTAVRLAGIISSYARSH